MGPTVKYNTNNALPLFIDPLLRFSAASIQPGFAPKTQGFTPRFATPDLTPENHRRITAPRRSVCSRFAADPPPLAAVATPATRPATALC